MTTKKILSFLLCFIMIFTAIPFAQTSAADGENPIKELKLPEEITLFLDSFHPEDSKELCVEAIGENEEEEPTGLSEISWRILDGDIVSREQISDTVIKLKAEKIGKTQVYAEIRDFSTDTLIVQAVCKVTVRKSLKAHIEEIKSLISTDMPSDIDDKEPKYASWALNSLSDTFAEIAGYLGKEETESSFAARSEYIISIMSEMEDSEENCTLVNKWRIKIMTAITGVINSPLAKEYDREYWGTWNDAYDAYADIVADIETDVFVENTVEPVREIINEYENTEWIDNEEYKNKLDALAQRLTQALSALKRRTTKLTFLYPEITRTYGCSPFEIPYETDGDEDVIWSSSNSRIASVQNGVVTVKTALPYGVEYVEITASSGDAYDTCKLYIKNEIASIAVDDGVVVTMGIPQKLEVEVHGSCDGYPVTQELEFASSDEEVVTVDSDGLITPVSKGTCIITVGVKGGDLEPINCYVTVREERKVSAVKVLSSSSPHVTVNAEATITLRVAPKDAVNRNIKWTSSDESIVTVTGNPASQSSENVTATIRGISEGTATVTYETTDGSNIKETLEVTVNPLVSSVVLDKTEIFTYIKSGESITIKATCLPDNAGNKLLDWESSNTDIATVVDGKIKIGSAGECTITARTRDGSAVMASARLVVLGSPASEDMEIKGAPALMNTGEKVTLSCTVVTKQGFEYSVRDWSVDDTSLATIDSNGVLHANRPGKVTVKANYFDEISCTKTITIYAPLEDISLTSSLTMAAGSTKLLVPTYTPSYASNKKVTWSTTDSSVVTVLDDGNIMAVGVGTANITAKSEEGGYIAVCKVTVYQPVKSITLNKTSYTLTIGSTDSVKLAATVSPSNATTKTVTWTSSNSAVATVSSSGTVTAVGPGNAVITVTTLDGGYKATCQITVKQPVNSIKFSSSSATYYVGQSKAMTVVFTPSNASNKALTYSSSNKSVATVDSSGKVTAKKTGSCTITAVSSDGGHKATCSLKVVKKVDVTEISLSKNSVSVNSGKTYQLTVTFKPSNASDKSVKWTTSDKEVATVNSNGVITGHKGGTATIKCTSSDTGVSDTCKVKVIEKPTSIKLSASSLTINVDKTKTITAEALPSTATDKSVSWSSTDTSVAKVSSSGKITAVGEGVCDIVAKSKADTSVSAKCRVTVLQVPKKITISETELKITRGDRAILSANVSPSGSYDMSVKWSSSKPSVAKVSSSGVVTAVSAGTAVITCTSVADPSIKKTCNVTVYQPVTGVKLSAEKLTLTTGRTKTLVTTVLPSKASNKKVTYTTSNKKVVKVNSKGKVEAVGPGKATVTVRTSDGFYTAKCVITVIEPVVSVSLNRKTATIAIGSSKTLTATVKPKKATNKNVTWRSSNPLVARVTQSGKVTAMAEGTATITCTTEDGAFKATCKITCVVPVDAVSLNRTSVTLKKGSTKTLKAKIYPNDATIQDVKWTSSDKSVAKVDSKGKITAVGKGTCVITCTTKQGSKKATCKVKVK